MPISIDIFIAFRDGFAPFCTTLEFHVTNIYTRVNNVGPNTSTGVMVVSVGIEICSAFGEFTLRDTADSPSGAMLDFVDTNDLIFFNVGDL